ncbi:MAG: GspH/FimT family pseudopilin [Cyanobacteria bacterium J06581_3]
MNNRPLDKPLSDGGFTLIEVLLVVVMVGIIAAIAAPSWLGLLSRQRMNAARTDLINTLKTAQTEAQSRQQSKLVEFSSTDLSVTVRNQFDSAGSVASTGGITTVLGNGEVNGDYQLSAPSTSIIFEHDGRVLASTPFTIRITDANSPAQSCVIVTTLLGGLKPANNDLCDSFENDPF